MIKQNYNVNDNKQIIKNSYNTTYIKEDKSKHNSDNLKYKADHQLLPSLYNNSSKSSVLNKLNNINYIKNDLTQIKSKFIDNNNCESTRINAIRNEDLINNSNLNQTSRLKFYETRSTSNFNNCNKITKNTDNLTNTRYNLKDSLKDVDYIKNIVKQSVDGINEVLRKTSTSREPMFKSNLKLINEDAKELEITYKKNNYDKSNNIIINKNSSSIKNNDLLDAKDISIYNDSNNNITKENNIFSTKKKTFFKKQPDNNTNKQLNNFALKSKLVKSSEIKSSNQFEIKDICFENKNVKSLNNIIRKLISVEKANINNNNMVKNKYLSSNNLNANFKHKKSDKILSSNTKTEFNFDKNKMNFNNKDQEIKENNNINVLSSCSNLYNKSNLHRKILSSNKISKVKNNAENNYRRKATNDFKTTVNFNRNKNKNLKKRTNSLMNFKTNLSLNKNTDISDCNSNKKYNKSKTYEYLNIDDVEQYHEKTDLMFYYIKYNKNINQYTKIKSNNNMNNNTPTAYSIKQVIDYNTFFKLSNFIDESNYYYNNKDKLKNNNFSSLFSKLNSDKECYNKIISHLNIAVSLFKNISK